MPIAVTPTTETCSETLPRLSIVVNTLLSRLSAAQTANRTRKTAPDSWAWRRSKIGGDERSRRACLWGPRPHARRSLKLMVGQVCVAKLSHDPAFRHDQHAVAELNQFLGVDRMH
jgi:hypothetical protein